MCCESDPYNKVWSIGSLRRDKQYDQRISTRESISITESEREREREREREADTERERERESEWAMDFGESYEPGARFPGPGRLTRPIWVLPLFLFALLALPSSHG